MIPEKAKGSASPSSRAPPNWGRAPQPPVLGVASAHPFVQQHSSIWRKMAILAFVLALQAVIVFLYLYFTGRVSMPYMLVPVTIVPASAH